MNVQRLIAELQKQDPEAKVIVVVEDMDEDDHEISTVERGDGSQGNEVWIY
jgi:hypothetical protein